MRMLIADDDRALAGFLARGLERDGNEISLAGDGEAAMEMARQDPPDMALIDLNLPRRDGTEVLTFLRSLCADLPILILTARQEAETRLRCLEMGADDFMQKPFSFAELRARCRALQRRRSPALILRHGGLELNRVERSVRRDGESVILTNKEFALLEYLMLHRGRPVSRATLLEQVWNTRPDTSTNVVDVYVNYLRRKLRDLPHAEGHPRDRHADGQSDSQQEPVPAVLRSAAPLIRTVRGLGYSIGLQP